MTIARVALPVATPESFDYWVPAGLAAQRGMAVRVRLAQRHLVGVVVEVAESTPIERERLQPIDEIVTDLARLPDDVLELARFVAAYYQEPAGLVHELLLPPLSAARRARAKSTDEQQASGSPAPKERAHFELNAAQHDAADAIKGALGTFVPFLLYGVTGSGKTEVYLHAADSAIASGGQVLLLVPEINLTPQLEDRIARALPDRRVVALHSRLAAGERRANWTAAANGDADFVVGTRLAVFTPLPRLALVVVDEEHDASYKQQEGVRYHARDVAVWRARQRGVSVVLGSATPSLESLQHARRGHYRRLDLAARALAPARLPQVRLVPQRGSVLHEGLAQSLIEAIGERVARGEQALVFVNRRGFSPSLLCSACGWQAQCARCTARLVVHRDARELRCHHCGHVERLAVACPSCGNVDLVPLGFGTQRLERALAERFPAARIARIDRDSTARKGTFEALRERVHAGDIDVLVGTQMLAKGHDFPRLTLVGVLGADNALYSGDFRATERLAALLFQVAGRAGRAELSGEVLVQTDFPTHPLYRALIEHDYDRLADTLLAERRVASFPPFAHLALVTAEARTREHVDAFLARVHEAGVAHARAELLPVEVMAPVPASLARRAGLERAQLLAQSERRAALQRFLPGWRAAIDALPGRRVRWALDVDPLALA